MQELRKKNKKTEWNWLHHPILLSLDQCFLWMVHPTRLRICEPSAAPWHWCELRQGWISSPGWWSGSLEGGQWALNQWQCPSHPLSFSTLGGKSAKNFQPFLTHPLKKAKKKTPLHHFPGVLHCALHMYMHHGSLAIRSLNFTRLGHSVQTSSIVKHSSTVLRPPQAISHL